MTRLKTSWLGIDEDTGVLCFWDGSNDRPLAEAAGYLTADGLSGGGRGVVANSPTGRAGGAGATGLVWVLVYQ